MQSLAPYKPQFSVIILVLRETTHIFLHPYEEGESLFSRASTLDSQDRLERVEQYPLYYFR